jgi:hypothetical protein
VPSNWSAWRLSVTEQARLQFVFLFSKCNRTCFFLFAMTAHSLQRQARVEQEVAQFREKIPEETDEDTKNKDVNDFRNEAMKKAKQQKAKASKEFKDQAKTGATAEAEQTPAAKKAPTPASSTTARQKYKGSKLAAGALSAVDEVNRSYYEIVQHDQDTILQHFGASYATEAALAIAAKNSLEGGIQD